MFKELFPGCIEILDFYHFSENVNEYATFLYSNDELSRKRWVNEIIELSLMNKSDDILTKIKKGSPESKLKDVVNLYEYLEDNKSRISYGEFKEKGYTIGSGVIESGNKCVIQNRLKQSGMRFRESKDSIRSIGTLALDFENFMRLARMENAKYDFKQGFYMLNPKARKFDNNSFENLKADVLSAMKTIPYRDKLIMMFEVTGQKEPSWYNGNELFIRKGAKGLFYLDWLLEHSKLSQVFATPPPNFQF
jgi:hypothetical protein